MPAVDKFSQTAPETQAPATSAFAITPNDTNELPYVTRALYVGGAGNVVVKMKDDSSTVTFVGVAAGTTLPIRVRLVTTASTATSMIGLF